MSWSTVADVSTAVIDIWSVVGLSVMYLLTVSGNIFTSVSVSRAADEPVVTRVSVLSVRCGGGLFVVEVRCGVEM